MAWLSNTHTMILIENNCKNACTLTDQPRDKMASLQELCNIRDNVVYSVLQIHEVNSRIDGICIEVII